MTKLYIAVPCYNEQDVLPDSAEKLLNKINEMINKGKISDKSRICFIDDGSKDDTWGIISRLCSENDTFCGIKMSANRGIRMRFCADF